MQTLPFAIEAVELNLCRALKAGDEEKAKLCEAEFARLCALVPEWCERRGAYVGKPKLRVVA